MCDKNSYSGNIIFSLRSTYRKLTAIWHKELLHSGCSLYSHTGRSQAINTQVHAHTISSPVQQISSAHAVRSCVDAECISKHHHLSPWSHSHSIWHQAYEHLSPLWHLSPTETKKDHRPVILEHGDNLVYPSHILLLGTGENIVQVCWALMVKWFSFFGKNSTIQGDILKQQTCKQFRNSVFKLTFTVTEYYTFKFCTE